MTVATYTSDLTDIFLFETTTNVSAYGGGGAGLGTGADFAMEGPLCVDKQITNAEKGFMRDNTSNFSIGADDHFFIWVMGATPGICDTRNNRGVIVAIGDDTSNFVKFHVNGSDTLPLGGGQRYVIRFVETSLANFRTLVGTPGTTPSFIGGGLKTTATAKAANLGVDGARIGTGYDILNGTGADPEANFTGISDDDEGTSEGIFQTAAGGYALQGKLRIGSTATACEFLDSNALIVFLDTRHSLTDFSEIILENASSILTLTTITFLGLGTNNPGKFVMITSAATATLVGCTFQDFGILTLGTGATFSDCKFINTDIITANGADLNGSTVEGFEGTANTSPLIWDTATDPDVPLDGMTFKKGTAATHAVEFGTTSPLTMTMRDMVATGFNAADGNNDSTFHVKRTSGTVTINVVGGTGNFSARTDGATVDIVIDPVTALVNVKDNDGANLQNARVFMEASDGTGDFPFEESVTITRAASTATVSHTAHGLVNGDLAVIRGADQQEYNTAHVITNVSANAYDYTVSGSPTTPATGTITSSGGMLDVLTDASGNASASRTFTTSQPIKGFVRKSSATPRFKSRALAGTIDNTTGLTINVRLILDE